MLPSQITVCNPSRASLLSGRRPDTTEIYGFEATTPGSWTTLPALFRRSGYTTVGVGKIFHWGPGPADAWSAELNSWAEPPPPGPAGGWREDCGHLASALAPGRLAAPTGPGGAVQCWETPSGSEDASMVRLWTFHQRTTHTPYPNRCAGPWLFARSMLQKRHSLSRRPRPRSRSTVSGPTLGSFRA